MWLLLEKSKKLIFALILSIVPLVFLYLQSKDYKIRSIIAWPIVETVGLLESATIKVTSKVSDFTFRYFSISSSYEELLQLRSDILKTQNLEIERDFFRNELLNYIEVANIERQLDLKNNCVGKIIATSGYPMFRTIRINKGKKHGINIKDPVVSSLGAVGQVLNASDNYSDILLLTDPSSSLDVKVLSTGARGILKGMTSNNSYMMQVRDIDGLIGLKDGDIIISSGVNSNFPGGIPIGYVENIHQNHENFWVSAEVRPLVNIAKLNMVMVLLNEEDTEEKILNWPVALK